MEKAHISENAFREVFDTLFENVKIISRDYYADKIDEALKIVGDIDKDDVPYFALALKIDGKIWSYEKALLKQSVVKVITTKDLLDILRSKYNIFID